GEDHEWKAWTWLVVLFVEMFGSSAAVLAAVVAASSPPPARARRPRDIRQNAGATKLQALACQVVDQVAHAAGVSPLIVIPGDHLDAVAANHQGHVRIYDRGARVALEIGRD